VAALRLFQHLGTENVGRHEIGGELDALVVEAEHRAHGVDEERLREARHADQQRVAARQDGDQGLVDDLFLAVDDLANGRPGRGDLGARCLDFLNGVAVRFTECLH